MGLQGPIWKAPTPPAHPSTPHAAGPGCWHHAVPAMDFWLRPVLINIFNYRMDVLTGSARRAWQGEDGASAGAAGGGGGGGLAASREQALPAGSGCRGGAKPLWKPRAKTLRSQRMQGCDGKGLLTPSSSLFSHICCVPVAPKGAQLVLPRHPMRIGTTSVPSAERTVGTLSSPDTGKWQLPSHQLLLLTFGCSNKGKTKRERHSVRQSLPSPASTWDAEGISVRRALYDQVNGVEFPTQALPFGFGVFFPPSNGLCSSKSISMLPAHKGPRMPARCRSSLNPSDLEVILAGRGAEQPCGTARLEKPRLGYLQPLSSSPGAALPL